MSTAIKFGTSGWRAIVADEFTVANIRLAVAGIAAYVKTQPGAAPGAGGARSALSGRELCGRGGAGAGRGGRYADRDSEAAPTPAIAYAVRTLKTSGAINFTASHNPPEYNGIKFSTHDGAPALPEVTKQIEAAIAALGDGAIPRQSPRARFETADVKPAFLKRLAELVDLKAIAKSGIKVVYDPFWGAGRGYSSDVLREAGVRWRRFTITAMCSLAAMRRSRTTTCWATQGQDEGDWRGLGIATDGDADRFGIVDGTGPSSSPTTSLRCCSTTWWRRAAGRTAWPRAWRPPT
jgi:phosphoglucomutase